MNDIKYEDLTVYDKLPIQLLVVSMVCVTVYATICAIDLTVAWCLPTNTTAYQKLVSLVTNIQSTVEAIESTTCDIESRLDEITEKLQMSGNNYSSDTDSDPCFT